MSDLVNHPSHYEEQSSSNPLTSASACRSAKVTPSSIVSVRVTRTAQANSSISKKLGGI